MLRYIVFLIALAGSPALAQQINARCQQFGTTTYCNGQVQQPPDNSGFQRLGEALGRAMAQRREQQQSADQQAAEDDDHAAAAAAENTENAERAYRKSEADAAEAQASKQVAVVSAAYRGCLVEQAKRYASPGVQPSDSIRAARANCSALREPVTQAVGSVLAATFNNGQPTTPEQVAIGREAVMNHFDSDATDAMTAAVLDELANRKKGSRR